MQITITIDTDMFSPTGEPPYQELRDILNHLAAAKIPRDMEPDTAGTIYNLEGTTCGRWSIRDTHYTQEEQ